MYSLVKQLKTTSKLINTFSNEDEVLKYIKENNLTFSYPYVFTCINLSNGLIIEETYNGMIVSPEKLRVFLQTHIN